MDRDNPTGEAGECHGDSYWGVSPGGGGRGGLLVVVVVKSSS